MSYDFEVKKKIREIYRSLCVNNSQILIFGTRKHAEIRTLVGQTDGNAIVITSKKDLKQINFNKNIYLFSQTTMPVNDFEEIINEIENKIISPIMFSIFNTICCQMLNRVFHICNFASKHSIVLFVASEKSSNGKILFNECKKINPNTYFISSEKDIRSKWLDGIESIGICGGTSTPKWLMEKVVVSLNSIFSKK